MPLSRHPADDVWVPRPQEVVFQAWLDNKRPCMWTLSGPGGSGKSALLHRFRRRAEANSDPLPVVHLDPARDSANFGASGLSLLLHLDTTNTTAFDKTRLRVRNLFETFAQQVGALLQTEHPSMDVLQALLAGVEPQIALGAKVARSIASAIRDSLPADRDTAAQPELKLLTSLSRDMCKGGVLLLDSWEQASDLKIDSGVFFRDDGTVEVAVTRQPHQCEVQEYLDGVVRFLYDHPVIVVVAGRYVPSQLFELPASYCVDPARTTQFSRTEVQQLVGSLVKPLPPPTAEEGEKIRQLTHGNALLVERFSRMCVADSEQIKDWRWQAVDWEELFSRFRLDQRFGLLSFMIERLANRIRPGDDWFWRLAIPRRLDVTVTAILFDDVADLDPPAIVASYERQGLLHREPDGRLFLHDFVREALLAHAEREGHLGAGRITALHLRLAEHFDEVSRWPAEYPGLDTLSSVSTRAMAALVRDQATPVRPQPTERVNGGGDSSTPPGSDGAESFVSLEDRGRTLRAAVAAVSPRDYAMAFLKAVERKSPKYFKPELLHGAFHALHGIQDFHIRYPRIDRGKLWRLLEGTQSLMPSEIRQIVHTFGGALSHPQMMQFLEILAHERRQFMELREKYTIAQLRIVMNENPRRVEDWPEVSEMLLGRTATSTEVARILALSGRVPASERVHWSQHVLASTPDDAEVRLRLATLYETTGLYDQAEEAYQRVLESTPTDVQVISWYADFLETVRLQEKDALELYQRALSIRSDYGFALSRLARLHARYENDADKAESLYRRALAAGSIERDAALEYALLLSTTGKQDAAEEVYEESLRAHPQSPDVIAAVARFRIHVREDYAGAESLLRRALGYRLAHASLQLYLAGILLPLDGPGYREGISCLAASFAIGFPSKLMRAEGLFYRACHCEVQWKEAAAALELLIEAGVRLTGLSLDRNVKSAARFGDERQSVLKTLQARLAAQYAQ